MNSTPFATVSREIGGRLWQTHAHLPPAVEDLCAGDLSALRARSDVTILGDKRLRSTLLVPCREALVLVKELKSPPGLKRVAWHLRGHPGRREWRWACRFAAAGLPVPTPWAYLHDGPGGTSWFLQEGLRGVEHVLHYYYGHRHLDGADDALWRALADRLGALLAQIHATGVNHPDLHPGNILCSGETVGTLRVALVDYHSIRRGVGPRRRYQAANLTKLFRHLEDAFGPTRARDVLRAYLLYAPPDAWESEEALAARIAAGVPRVIQRRAHSRAKKAFTNSSGFAVTRRGNRRIWYARDQDPDTVSALVDRITAGAVPAHKARPGSSVYDVALGDGRRVWVKSYTHAGIWKQAEVRVGRAYGRRGWHALERMRHLGFAVPASVAYVEEWDGVWLRRSHLVTGHVDHVTDLDTLLFTGSRVGADPARVRRKRALIRELADLVRRLHRFGVFHRDLSAKNLLLTRRDGAWTFVLIDVDSIRFLLAGVGRRARARNLAQLTGLPSTITLRDRVRFYRAYCGGPEAMRRSMANVALIMRLGRKTRHAWQARETDALTQGYPGPHTPAPPLPERVGGPGEETPPTTAADSP